MKVEDVLACSFPSWYQTFRHVTFRSIIIPLPSSFMDYLNTDSIVLPENSTHGIYPSASNIVMNEDDDDPDLRDDDLIKQYEADWSAGSTNDTPESKFPDLNELDTQVKAAIKDLGGRAFPKLNWSCPKDASWVAFDKSLMCTCPSDVYLLLKSSEFISHDTDQPFTQCKDMLSAPHSVDYCLILREWCPPDPSTEFRCFVQEGQLVGICQRNSTKFYPFITRDKHAIAEDISKFFRRKIVNRFPLTSYIFDITRLKPGCITLVDFNPFGCVTDGILFSWDELSSLSDSCETDNKGDLIAQFRCVESEAGVRVHDYANYAFSRDIQDLVAGTDPYKFLDLMNLKIQSADGDESSSDEDEANQAAGRPSSDTGCCSQTRQDDCKTEDISKEKPGLDDR